MKLAHSVSRFLLDTILVFAGVLGSMFCLFTAFSFEIPEGFWIVAISCVIFNCLILGHEKRWDRIAALALLLGIGLLVFVLRHEMVESFRNLWGTLGRHYALGYDQVLDFLPREPTTPEAAGPAMTAITILEAYICSVSIRYWRRTLPSALVLLLGVAPCFVLTDTSPDLLPLFAVVFSVLTQAFSQSARRRSTEEHSKAVALAALLSAAVLGLLLLIFPQDYKPSLSWNDLTSEMERWGRQQSNRGNILAGLGGNPDEVDLSDLGALPNHAATAIYATSSQDAYLYLRGSSYTDFDGTHWNRGAEAEWSKENLFPYLRQTGGYTLTIETVDKETLLYTTYQLTDLPTGGEVVSDGWVRNAGERRRYTMRWLQNPEPLGVADPAYEQWVADHCLELPKQTREGVLAWWDSVSHRGVTMDAGVEEYAQTVANAVKKAADYSRNPLPMPEDVDFCTWFLNDADEGYCVHFATSCTALLRALGVPARYVSGYVCALPAGRRTAVTNLQAHAWVEIWSGGRWVVIEPTPDQATEFSGQLEIDGDRTDMTEPPETTTPATEQTPVDDTLPPMTGWIDEPTRPSQDPAETVQPNSRTEETEPVDLTPLWIFLGVVGLLALILGRRALALRLWEMRLARAEGNEKARLLYRRILRLHRLGGGEIPEEADRLAKRASFSQHKLEPEELHYLQQVFDRQVSRLGISRFWWKLWCKYGLAVI